jgi:hypothetical protein
LDGKKGRAHGASCIHCKPFHSMRHDKGGVSFDMCII